MKKLSLILFLCVFGAYQVQSAFPEGENPSVEPPVEPLPAEPKPAVEPLPEDTKPADTLPDSFPTNVAAVETNPVQKIDAPIDAVVPVPETLPVEANPLPDQKPVDSNPAPETAPVVDAPINLVDPVPVSDPVLVDPIPPPGSEPTENLLDSPIKTPIRTAVPPKKSLNPRSVKGPSTGTSPKSKPVAVRRAGSAGSQNAPLTPVSRPVKGKTNRTRVAVSPVRPFRPVRLPRPASADPSRNGGVRQIQPVRPGGKRPVSKNNPKAIAAVPRRNKTPKVNKPPKVQQIAKKQPSCPRFESRISRFRCRDRDCSGKFVHCNIVAINYVCGCNRGYVRVNRKCVPKTSCPAPAITTTILPLQNQNEC